jgi:hypothetical protein
MMIQFLVEHHSNPPASSVCHQAVRIVRFVQGKTVGHEFLRVQFPRDKMFYWILHEPDARYPGAMDSLLVVQEIGAWIEADAPPSPTRAIFPHLRVARTARRRASSFPEQSIARSQPLPAVSSLT